MVKKVASSIPSSARPTASAPECIRLRGVRQNNLKGFDLDLPLGRYVVVTGLSGAGKSSLLKAITGHLTDVREIEGSA